MAKFKRIKTTGARRMQEQGYRQSQVWMDQTEYASIAEAAGRLNLPVATYLRQAAVARAAAEGVTSEYSWGWHVIVTTIAGPPGGEASYVFSPIREP